MRTVLCVGTNTGAGKTWVGAAVLSRLRHRGALVVARKPAQSFDPDLRGPTDADVLATATGQHPRDVCPEHRWYPQLAALPIAAALLERPGFLVADLIDELRLPDIDEVDGPGVVWIEADGGPLTPIADDGDAADLARWALPDLIVLVADADDRDAINDVRLAAIPFAGRRLVVVLNRFTPSDALHRANAAWLDQAGFDVLVDVEDLVELLATPQR